VSDLQLLGGAAIGRLLDGSEEAVVEAVRVAYLAHDRGETVNPDSHFLRFPHRPEARIIALPAYLGGSTDVAGIKWISSFPANHQAGLPRASAVLVLNDMRTGIPYAVLESARISAARTAASSALAASVLVAGSPATVGFLGGGPIARTIHRYLGALELTGGEIRCHDARGDVAEAMASGIPAAHSTDAAAVLDCDLVVLATSAGKPYIGPDTVFRAGQTILNISLRDLAPEILLGADNFFDDVEHCMKADTSPHLAEQLTGGRDFVTGTLADVLLGRRSRDPGRPAVFSPFGLGVLDLAAGDYVYHRAADEGLLTTAPDFFA
jgi:ornithine cyclodeaminase